ncbi:MAG: hypothetical protein QXL96_01880 [Ignisphaera sp.]
MYIIVSLDIILGISLYFIAILIAVFYAVKTKGRNEKEQCSDS